MKKAILRKSNVLKIVLCLIIAVFVLSLSAATGCDRETYYIKKSFKRDFGIDMYKGVERIYYDEDVTFHDAYYYTVWQFPDVPEEILQNKGFYLRNESNKKELYNENTKNSFKMSVPQSHLKKIPQEYIPDWDREFLSGRGNRSVYFPDTNRIIVWYLD